MTDKTIYDKKCIDVIDIYIPFFSNQFDYKLAKELATHKAKYKYGDNINVILLSDVSSKLTFIVLK